MSGQAPQRQAFTPQEAAYALGLGESKLRELYLTGALRYVRVGRRILIPATEIVRFLSGGGQAEGAPR